MATVTNFKDTLNLPKWRFLAGAPLGGSSLGYNSVCDLRNNIDKHPFIYSGQNSSGSFAAYNTKNDGWLSLTSPTLASGFTAMFFMSGQGPRGTIAAGATTTSIPLTTVLPASIGPNQLANRGDGTSFKVRIIGNAAGSSGKIEERYITANSGPSTTPTITLNSPLSFTPISGDTYEFLSGRIFLMGSSNAAGNWKYYDVLTNSFSGNLSTTNLPAGLSFVNLVGLDELLVPFDKNPGEGFLGILTATGSGATSLTGQTVGGDASVLQNEYRNFQIRIVEDTGNVLAVGQRRNIVSHTAGINPQYTVVAWTQIPSATCKYAIENNGDLIICWVNGSTQTSTYTIAGNTWDANVTFAARGIGANNPSSVQAFSIEPDVGKNVRHSFIYSFRGNNILDLFDIAGAATGIWTNGITYGNSGSTLINSIFGGYIQDSATNQGKYIYLIPTGSICYRFDMRNRVLEQYTALKTPIGFPSRTSTALSHALFIDGSTKISTIIHSTVSSSFGNTFPPLTFGLTITR